MAKKKEEKQIKEEKVKLSEDSKLFAFLAVFLSIIGFVIALLAKKEDKYVMYYAKQSFVLFICFLIVSAVGLIPIVGWISSPILAVLVFILWIIVLVNSLSGEIKETPVVGIYGNKLNL